MQRGQYEQALVSMAAYGSCASSVSRVKRDEPDECMISAADLPGVRIRAEQGFLLHVCRGKLNRRCLHASVDLGLGLSLKLAFSLELA